MNSAALSSASSAPKKLSLGQNIQSENPKSQKASPGAQEPKSTAPQVQARIKSEKPDNSQAQEPESKEVQEYLKVIDRLEQALKTGDMDAPELEKVVAKLQDKISQMTPTQQKKLLRMDFFMRHKIEDLKTMKDTLVDFLGDLARRSEAVELLKDPQFIALLNDLPESKGGDTYAKSGMTTNNLAKPISTQQIKA
ncbi:MAG: hypothetical protein RRB13_12990 [bacterium]|nr:hypothetical protein [bacterium]